MHNSYCPCTSMAARLSTSSVAASLPRVAPKKASSPVLPAPLGLSLRASLKSNGAAELASLKTCRSICYARLVPVVAMAMGASTVLQTERAKCDEDAKDIQAAFGTDIIDKLGQAFWETEGQSTLQQPRSNARIFASLDSDDGKADGARKALEQAFQGKSIAKKWEEEIRKRELSGGDDGGSRRGGGGGSGGWGGGGGGDDEEMSGDYRAEPWDWEEIGQTFMATFVLLVLYLSITRGPKQVFKKFKLLFRYIRQGFRLRKIPDEYLRGSDDDSDDEDYDGDSDDDVAQEGHRTREELSTSNAREGDVQDNSPNYETEEDEDDGIPTPPRQQVKREDLLSKRQAEHKEKLFKMLSPKELLQQQQEEERK